MKYDVEFTPNAETDLSRLDKSVAQRVLNRLRWLSENFDSVKPEALKGKLRSMFKLRVGDYRVFYTRSSSHRQILVHLVRHRREVYKVRSLTN